MEAILTEWINIKFHKFMLKGINKALDTDFSDEGHELGNRINHELTVKFVESGFDMKVLEGWCK